MSGACGDDGLLMAGGPFRGGYSGANRVRGQILTARPARVEESERVCMAARQYATLLSILATTLLGGCSQMVGLYHDAEGGAIAQHRQPPPGANLPYPNLADVPPPPGQAQPAAPAGQGVSAVSQAALAGLALPTAPPPLPVISGLTLSSGLAAPQPSPQPPALVHAQPVARPPGPPVSIAFRPGSALLPYSQRLLVEGVAAKRADAHIRVCGFGGGSLWLATARARRLADALTAVGVPGNQIDMEAFAEGSGGFVQLVY